MGKLNWTRFFSNLFAGVGGTAGILQFVPPKYQVMAASAAGGIAMLVGAYQKSMVEEEPKK